MRARAPRGIAARIGFIAALGLALALGLASAAMAQEGGAPPEASKLVKPSVAPVSIQAGGKAEAVVALEIEPRWHVNANPPALDYMIPTRVRLAPAAGVTAGKPGYPSPHRAKLSFEETELLVYDGRVEIRLPLAAAANAVNGAHALKGEVSFQACNDQLCLAPATVPFTLAVTVTGGSSAPSGGTPAETTATHAGAPDSGAAPPPAPGFATGPPPGGAAAAALDNPFARALTSGSLAAYGLLFLIGLGLNLTPCVFPMLGVTVSIFGARRKAPLPQVLTHAAVYVLGIAAMYTPLGAIAGLTGQAFGSALQNPLVSVGVGLFLIALSLSMFGLYEFQAPLWLTSKVGGATTTGVLGTFLAGLVVGVIAAPCIGPPIAALLLVVGAKGDPWFGLRSFFVLSLGLGAPYLVLATFSNLLQRLPRSGEWMVWVKKVFGTIMVSVGLFYGMLGLAPRAAVWVLPVALIVGGLYLGFFERSQSAKRGFTAFRRAVGVVLVGLGVWLVASAPREGLRFAEFSAPAMAEGFSRGRPAMIDFTADWCVPCHEMERSTFTDPRVMEAARDFQLYRVDLTRYDSPEADGWRKRYGIAGVPTVLFLRPDGSEVRGARAEGFVPPERFLERIRAATTLD